MPYSPFDDLDEKYLDSGESMPELLKNYDLDLYYEESGDEDTRPKPDPLKDFLFG